MYFRQDMHSITTSVDTVGDGVKRPLGWVWATFEGGNLEADDGKVRPGGMGNEIALGGPASRQDATLTIPFSDFVFAQHKPLEDCVIFSAPITVSIRMLTRRRNPAPGTPLITITGVVKSTKVPDLDVTSADPGMYELVVSCDEVAG